MADGKYFLDPCPYVSTSTLGRYVAEFAAEGVHAEDPRFSVSHLRSHEVDGSAEPPTATSMTKGPHVEAGRPNELKSRLILFQDNHVSTMCHTLVSTCPRPVLSTTLSALIKQSRSKEAIVRKRDRTRPLGQSVESDDLPSPTQQLLAYADYVFRRNPGGRSVCLCILIEQHVKKVAV